MNIYQFRDLCASVLFMVLVACALPYVPAWIWIAATAAVVIVAAFMFHAFGNAEVERLNDELLNSRTGGHRREIGDDQRGTME